MGLCATGVALLLSSCSTSKPEPPLISTNGGLTYEIRIFDVPANHSFGDKPLEILNPERGALLLSQLDREPTFSATTSGRSGQTKKLSNRKKFVYPDKYSPPQLPKPDSSAVVGSSFPVTPATPQSFVTTEIGTTVSLNGKSQGTNLTELEIQLDRKILLGFTNHGKPITTEATDFFGKTVPIVITENRMEKPNFLTEEIETSVTLTNGAYLILRNPDAKPVQPSKLPFTEKRPPGFIAVIRVAGH
ncbi:hypothetical protein N9Y81_02170 [Akkermansiaceae bacterium]|jgi:hypothetical protein|nr:hypothetical protein [Akkermansiaceae bacterium]